MKCFNKNDLGFYTLLYYVNYLQNKCTKLSLIFIGIIMLLTNGCHNSENVHIGFLFNNFQIERYTKDRAYFEERASEIGVQYTILSAEGNELIQIDQAIELIESGVDVLIVNACNVNSAAAIVREAHDNNVKIISYDRMIKNSTPDVYVSFDNVRVGELMAEFATQQNPSGNYVLLGGDYSDNNALMVKQGQKNILKPFIRDNRIQIIYDIYVEGWSDVNAAHEVDRLLRFFDGEIDVILSSNDRMASGTAQMLEKYGKLGNVLLTGQDADIKACRRILRGEQAMTIYKPIKDLAYATADLAVNIAKSDKSIQFDESINNGRADIPALLLEPVVVTKDNIENTVIADGFYKRGELFVE